MAINMIQAGAGDAAATGNSTPDIVSGVTVGNIIILHCLQDGTGTNPTFAANNIEDLAGNDNAWTTIVTGASIGSPTAAKQHILIGRALATAVDATVTPVAGDDLFSRLYEFSGVNPGTTLDDVIENASAGSFSNEIGTGTTISDASVVTLGAGRLACQFVGVNDDNAVGDFTGETGGNWLEAVAEFAVATGTDACLQIQIATIASAGTIDGGSFTMGASDSWGVIGFALKPAAVQSIPPVHKRPERGLVLR